MSDITTIARPYARAIFEYALAEKKLAEWSAYLHQFAQAVQTTEAAQFIANPASSVEQQEELMLSVIKENSEKNKALRNVVALLASNKRLMLLPAIQALYEAFKAEQEKTLDVTVSSFADLSAEQQKRLQEALSNRLQRKVSLKVTIDPTLLGGAVIQAGDLVIDGSVRGKLNKLYSELAA